MSIEFTAETSERVEGLVLSAPGIGGFDWSQEWLTYEAEIGNALNEGNMVEAMQLVLKLTYGPRRLKEVVDSTLVNRVQTSTMKNWMKRATSNPGNWEERPTRERLKSVTSPALVLIGSEDFEDIIRIADVLENELSSVRKVVVPGVAHQVNMEAPNVFNGLALEFLTELVES